MSLPIKQYNLLILFHLYQFFRKTDNEEVGFSDYLESKGVKLSDTSKQIYEKLIALPKVKKNVRNK